MSPQFIQLKIGVSLKINKINLEKTLDINQAIVHNVINLLRIPGLYNEFSQRVWLRGCVFVKVGFLIFFFLKHVNCFSLFSSKILRNRPHIFFLKFLSQRYDHDSIEVFLEALQACSAPAAVCALRSAGLITVCDRQKQQDLLAAQVGADSLCAFPPHKDYDCPGTVAVRRLPA